MIGRRKSTAPPATPSSEKKKDKSRPFAPFRRADSSRSFQDLSEPVHDLTPQVSTDERAVPQPRQLSSEHRADGGVERIESRPMVNGTQTQSQTLEESTTAAPDRSLPAPQTKTPPPQELSAVPTTPDTPQRLQLLQPLQPLQPLTVPQPETDETSRNLLIRDTPIPEDEGEAKQAMDNVANQLRMQAQSSGMNRVQGSVRGRRDVRNTVYVPNTTETPPGPAGILSPIPDILAAATTDAQPALTSIAALPLKPLTPVTIPEDHAVSDTTSVHSSQSLATLAHHPEMAGPGLNASIVETVNTWFAEGHIQRSFAVGEIALAYNPRPFTETPSREVIRLENFQVLEKVAANPAFVTAVGTSEEQAGCYEISLAAIQKAVPTVALKYQLHLDDTNLSLFSPILLQPAWQLQDNQASVIVLYRLNPVFGHVSLTLKNVVIAVSLDTSTADAPRAVSAIMSPTQGASFRRKQSMVAWRFNELAVDAAEAGEPKKLLVRFATASAGPSKIPHQGTVEAKWELTGRAASTLDVRKQAPGPAVETDPFTDEGADETVQKWTSLPCHKKLISGRYCAS